MTMAICEKSFGVRILTTTVLVSVVSLFLGPGPAKCGPLSYIVQEGCLFLAHYVRDNYIVLEPTTPLAPTNDVNWATWTYQQAEARYMPPELTEALVHCGKAHAFYALLAPEWMLLHYNMTETESLVG